MSDREHSHKVRKEIITSGTFLRSYCPYCENSLTVGNNLKLIIIEDGKKGQLMLSPYLNVFISKSTITIPERSVATDLKCPHCSKSLIQKEQRCPRCNSEIARIKVAAMSKMIDFFICAKKGCTWHGLSDEDIQDIILEDSEEW
ncbi:MAG: hypothetical protein JXA22_02230 [Candidatus Thermoplasmatota archaeon]|nr:hypothetical protein [Candidatus Thermoplasmatota archaeon]